MTPYSWVIYIVLCTGGGYRQRVNIGTVRDDFDRDHQIESIVKNYSDNENLKNVQMVDGWRWSAITLKKSFVIARETGTLSPLTYRQFEAELRIRT